MNLLIWFVLLLAIHYRFGTACSPNKVEIHNRLGPGIVLNFHCRCKNPKCDLGNQQLEYNKSYLNKKKEKSPINFEREEIDCLLRYDKYYHDVVEKDGIYFKTRHDEPWRFRFHWNVGK
ncbi:hypothetical protein N665_1137s0025 [Sinapis alba]|nr:hypothetical protein N665_1137s0025 [Sinapis alba]